MDKSHPLPPLLGHIGGTYFLVRGCYQNSVRESKEQGKEKKREGRESTRGTGLPSQILKSPTEDDPRSLALALPPGSTQRSSQLHPLPNSPASEAPGQSCEEGGRRGERREGTPKWPIPSCGRKAGWGGWGRRQRQEGDSEAEAGQQKGRVLERKLT